MFQIKRLLFFLLVVSWPNFVAAEEFKENPIALTFTQLAEFMQGDWQGMAVKTPVGQVAYDIRFSVDKDGLVGVADTGDSLHHWQFIEINKKLKLRFLSTFRGNTKPRYLEYSHSEKNSHYFHHHHPGYLRVKITQKVNLIELHIFLRDESHVKIELKRIPPPLA